MTTQLYNGQMYALDRLDRRILSRFEQDNGFALTTTTLIMACYVGSHSHGTHDPKPGSIDDTDYMLIVQPPAERVLGLHKWEHWTFKEAELDVVAYSLDKFVRLVLKANPNVVGTLWLRNEDYVCYTPRFVQLIGNRNKFSSLEAYNSFYGYAYSQLKRLENGAYKGYMGEKRKQLVQEFGYDPKNASHLIRLYRMGVEFIRDGVLNVYRQDADELKRIKRGEWSLEQIRAEAETLEQVMREAKVSTPLPEKPNYSWAENFLIEAQFDALYNELAPTSTR